MRTPMTTAPTVAPGPATCSTATSRRTCGPASASCSTDRCPPARGARAGWTATSRTTSTCGGRWPPTSAWPGCWCRTDAGGAGGDRPRGRGGAGGARPRRRAGALPVQRGHRHHRAARRSAPRTIRSLARLAAGEEIAVLAVAFSDPPGRPVSPSGPASAGRRGCTGGDQRRRRRGRRAAAGAGAPGRGPGAARRPGGRRRGAGPAPAVAGHHPADLRCSSSAEGAVAGWRRRCSRPGRRAERAVSAALSTAAGLLASEQLGVAEWCLDTTVDYVKQRRQFARPVGSFQALKHRLADVWLEVTAGPAAARYAADALAHRGPDPDTAVAVALAQSFCSRGRRARGGGVHPAARRHRHDLGAPRASLPQAGEEPTEIALGTPGRHRAELAHLVDLPAPADPPRPRRGAWAVRGPPLHRARSPGRQEGARPGRGGAKPKVPGARCETWCIIRNTRTMR